MAQRYKLPCSSCARVLEVTVPQAGEILQCTCGAEVVVPTMRQLRQLEVVEGSAGVPVESWNVQRGALFVAGMLLLAIGLCIHLQIAPLRHELDLRQPGFRDLDFDVQTLTLTQAWEAWEYFRGQHLQFRPTPRHLVNRERHRKLGYYLYAAWAIAGLGVVLVGWATGPQLFRRAPRD